MHEHSHDYYREKKVLREKWREVVIERISYDEKYSVLSE